MKIFKIILSVVLLTTSCNKDEIVTEPTNMREVIVGVNIQRVFKTSLHPNLTTEEQIIDRVAELINRFKFNSIRIGGTASFGGTFDPTYKGFGWSKYMGFSDVSAVHPSDPFSSEPYNYNIIALKTAKKANVSVWIDLHRYMTQEDINYAMHLVDSLGIELAGVTRDNEPYIRERDSVDIMENAYQDLSSPKFEGFSWPAMSVISPDLGNQGSREGRQIRCIDLVNNYRLPEEKIEIHSYVPFEYTGSPEIWINSILSDTRTAYSVTNSQIMLGEWSGKKQYQLTETRIETIISDFLNVLQEEKIDSYYQILGSGVENEGLYNFLTDTENRGANIFKNR